MHPSLLNEAAGSTSDSLETPHLKAGALSFTSILMQAITHIAPATGLVLCLQFVSAAAGVASPLAYAIAFVIVLTLGISLTQLARILPSAGGYYTYVSRTVHPYAGFLTAWVYFLYDPLAAAANLAIMSFFLEATLRSEYHLILPWWISFLALSCVITVVIFRGVSVSVRTTAIVGIAEITIVIALAIWSIAQPGNPGGNLIPFSSRHWPGIHGLYLGVVFCIFAFSGFESVAPLAEESRDPRRNLPRVIMWSILLMGAFYVFCAWAFIVGWGTNSIQGLISSNENPVFVLARRLWGGAWIFLLLAVFNSTLACAMSCTNAATRVFFAMGRAGALPKILSKVHPRYRTPVNAIWLQTIVTLMIGLGLGFWFGPDQEFYFLGVTMTLGMVLVYIMGNIGVFQFYKGAGRSQFKWTLHFVFPLISTVALLSVAYESVFLLPSAPIGYAPVVVAVWLCGGGLLVWILNLTGHEHLLLDAGQSAYENGAEVQSPAPGLDKHL